MTKNDRTNRCENCQFVNNDSGTPGWYSCRRYAPRPPLNGEIDMHMKGGMMTCWPGVNADDWCGEYQAKASA